MEREWEVKMRQWVLRPRLISWSTTDPGLGLNLSFEQAQQAPWQGSSMQGKRRTTNNHT
jgi:hypothetical protein